jgi:hypothetical protein
MFTFIIITVAKYYVLKKGPIRKLQIFMGILLFFNFIIKYLHGYYYKSYAIVLRRRIHITFFIYILLYGNIIQIFFLLYCGQDIF